MLLVGSFRFNCRLPDSDINALCLLPRYITREDFLAHLPPLLRLNPGVSIVFALPSEPTSPFSSPTVVARSVFCNVTFTYTLVTHQSTCRFNGYDISIVPAFLDTDTVSAALDVIMQALCLTSFPSLPSFLHVIVCHSAILCPTSPRIMPACSHCHALGFAKAS